MPDALKYILCTLNIWLSESKIVTKYLMEVNTIFYLSYNGWKRRVIQSKGKISIRQKYISKEIGDPILVRFIISRETWLNNFGGLAVSYISDIHFERLAAGDTTECRLGITFFTWCILKLYCYVTFCIACLILIADNYVIYMGIKIIFWG